MKLLSTIVIIIGLFKQTYSSECDGISIRPCECISETKSITIQCQDSQEPLDLHKTFSRLSSETSKKVKEFDKFILTCPTIETINKNATGLVIFKSIEIDGPNIRRIHTQAFIETAHHVKSFSIGKSMKLLENEESFSFFDLINTLISIETLSIESPIFDVIPSEAFNSLPRLTYIRIDFKMNKNYPEDRTKKLIVEDYAFAKLTNESVCIELKRARINQISAQMLQVKTNANSGSRLDFDLSGNNLTSTSFSSEFTKPNHRQTTLNLANNPISYLNVNFFKPFLELNQANEIDATNLMLDCGNEHNVWWLKLDAGYYPRITEDKCITTEPRCSEAVTRHCRCGKLPEIFGKGHQNLFCEGEKPIDLNRIFKRMSLKLKKKERKFGNFKLDNLIVEELGPNTTGLVTFRYTIEINAPNIKRVHSKAFIGTAKEVKELEIGDLMDHYKSLEAPYNFFDMIDSMTNLKQIRIKSPIFDSLSSTAFKSNSRLYWIEINFGNHRNLPENKVKIEDGVFYNLTNLYALQLKNLYIDRVSAKMLEIKPSSNTGELNLDLARNKLHSASFEVGCFEHLNRPTKLYIGINSGINYLDKRIFKPFLNADERNTLDVYGLPLECDHKRNRWWVKEPKFKSRIKEMKCVDKDKANEKENDLKKETIKTTTETTKETITEINKETTKKVKKDEIYNSDSDRGITYNLDNPSDFKAEEGASKFGCRVVSLHAYVCKCKWKKDFQLKSDGDKDDNWYIECHLSLDFSFDHQFDEVFKELSLKEDKERHFKGFIFKNALFKVLDQNITGNLIFDHIIIDAPNIEKIHWEAFVETAKNVKKFEIGESMKKYQSQEAPFNFFDLVNSMVNLEILDIDFMVINEIPGNTLKLPKLKELFFHSHENKFKNEKKSIEDSFNPMRRRLEIEGNAFYHLVNLTRLSLRNVGLNWIPYDMFNQLSRTSFNDVRLTNNELTPTSFQVGCFNYFQHTSLSLDNNQIPYLDEWVFSAFLDVTDNHLSVVDVQLDYDDSRNHWWLYNETYCKKIDVRYINGKFDGDRDKTRYDCRKKEDNPNNRFKLRPSFIDDDD